MSFFTTGMNEQPKVQLDISPVMVAKVILILAFFVFLFFIRDIILVVLAAVVIASAIEPATLWLEKQKVRRVFGVVMLYLALALLFVGVIYFFLPKLVHELSGFVSNLSDYADLLSFGGSSPAASAVGDAANHAAPASTTLRDVINGIQNSLGDESGSVFGPLKMIFGGAASFILTIVLSFYLAVQEDGVADFLRIITPLSYQKQTIDLWKRSQHKIGLWMQGQIVLGAIVGILVYIGLSIFHVPHALLLACLSAVFEIIPIFGPVFSSIPGILIATGERGTAFGLGIALLYLGIQQVESHIIYPLVVKKVVGVSPIVVILALIIGAKLGGIVGILLSVPVAAALMEYFHDIQKRKGGTSA